MNLRSTIILLILFIFFADSLLAQDTVEVKLDQVYNMNPELYNGKVFTGIYRGKIDGTQFFISKKFLTGELRLNQQVFKQQKLNYDVYDQKVLLSFKDDINATKIIELPLANVEFFYLDSKYFEVHVWLNGYRIFQTFGINELKILLYWTRTLNAGTGSESSRSRFSSLKKRIWLFREGSYYAVKNNKTLRKLYTDEQQLILKKWQKKNKIKIQKADDEQLQMIIDYLTGL